MTEQHFQIPYKYMHIYLWTTLMAEDFKVREKDKKHRFINRHSDARSGQDLGRSSKRCEISYPT